MIQKPSVAQTVLAVGAFARSNGTDVAPAIITRVWGEREDGNWTLNVKVLPDAGGVNNATSVTLYADEESAREAIGDNQHATACFWPARV